MICTAFLADDVVIHVEETNAVVEHENAVRLESIAFEAVGRVEVWNDVGVEDVERDANAAGVVVLETLRWKKWRALFGRWSTEPIVRDEHVAPWTGHLAGAARRVAHRRIEQIDGDRLALAADELLLWALLAVAELAHAGHALFHRAVVQGAQRSADVAEIAPTNGVGAAPIAPALIAWWALRRRVGHAVEGFLEPCAIVFSLRKMFHKQSGRIQTKRFARRHVRLSGKSELNNHQTAGGAVRNGECVLMGKVVMGVPSRRAPMTSVRRVTNVA